jgi:hypothetical protein
MLSICPLKGVIGDYKEDEEPKAEPPSATGEE